MATPGFDTAIAVFKLRVLFRFDERTDTSRKSTILSIDKNDNGVIDKKVRPDKINH